MSKAFVPLIRSMWPGIDDGNSKNSSYVVSNQRKRAVQASRFMVQMMQTPLYKSPDSLEESIQAPLDRTEEGLAIRIAIEVSYIPLMGNCRAVLTFRIFIPVIVG